MLKQEHVKQASTEKVTKFTSEMVTQIFKHIDESGGYLNDTEQVMCAVLLGNTISSACEDTIGNESVKIIMEHITSTKEKTYERKEDNQKKW